MGSRKPDNIKRINEIYDEELWRAHEMNHSRLVRTCREQLVKQYTRRNAPHNVLEAVESALDTEALTIAFARRFATYKRANLLLQDPERLEAIINNKNRPVQFIFAGKAHPKDDEGKELIKRLFQFASKPQVASKIIFLEDYDMHLARHLGWWDEGYTEESGWRIGNGEEYKDHGYQDAIESQALYNVLENEVIPCFYDRKNGNPPTCWIKKMKASMKMAMESFCSLRMVSEYENRYYRPAATHRDFLVAREAAEAKKLATQIKRLRSLWKEIKINPPVRQAQGPYRVGDAFQVTSEVHLAELQPDEVDVELYYGNLKSPEQVSSGHVEPMKVVENRGNGNYLYGCDLNCEISGRFGYTVRVAPSGDKRIKSTPRLLSWA
jgi:starch phosphorylase